MKTKLKIAIIGSGSAGAASALFLHKEGHHITLFEREKEPKPVGAGIMLQPTGLKVLNDLGLYPSAISLGTKIFGMNGTDISGRKVVDLSFENDNNLFGLGIHRSALFYLLFNQVFSSGIDVELGQEIVEIRGEDKKQLLTTEGKVFGDFDLVIVANGSRSILRKSIDIVKFERKQEYGALWAKIPCDNALFGNKIHQYYYKSRKMLGFMPIGKPSEDAQEYVNFFWSIKMSEVDAWKANGLDVWKKEILELNSDFKSVIDKIVSLDQIMIAPYMDVMLKPNYKDNVVFVGDAAHPMSPQLSQGASFALLDAKYLAKAISKHETINSALEHFYESRRTQVNYYQNLSRWITPMFQSDDESTWFRDSLFKVATSLKPSRNILLGTVLGYRKSYFSELEKEDYLV